MFANAIVPKYTCIFVQRPTFFTEITELQVIVTRLHQESIKQLEDWTCEYRYESSIKCN